MTSDTPAPPNPAGAPLDPGRERAPSGPDALRSRHLDLDTLSACLDQQLPPAELAAARAHLASCPDCAQELAELRATVTLVRALPLYAPRRGFQLGPAHARRGAGRRPRLVRGREDWFARLLPALPALRLATAAVAVLLVAVIAGDLITNRDPGNIALRSPAGSVEVVDAPDAAMPAAPRQAAPAPSGGQVRSAAPPSAAETDEAESFAESAPANGTDPAPPASNDADGAGQDAPGEAASAPAADPAPSAPPSGWRLAQAGLGLALLWLIVSLTGLARWRRTRSAASPAEPPRDHR